MCGHVGAAGHLGLSEERAFKLLLQIDTIRGPHSTGVLFVNTFGKSTVVKKLGTPWDLEDSKDFSNASSGFQRVLMGHNRYATKGKVTARNAHPFEFDHIIGAHNGTLVTQYQLDDYRDFEVDSENLYHHMNNNGANDTIPKLNGAFALVWYDKRDKTINFVRNKERSFYYTFTTDRKTIFWASEDWMLKVALGKSGIKHDEVLELPPLMHRSIVIENAAQNKGEALPLMVSRPVQGYKAPVYTGGNSLTTSNVTKLSEVKATPVKKQTPVRDGPAHIRLLRKPVEFFVSHEGTSVSGQSYIQAFAVHDIEISIRLFAIKGTELWNTLMDSTSYFKCESKGFTNIDGGYLVADLRSVEAVDTPFDNPAVDEPEETFYVYANRAVNEEGFKSVVACGCAWCTTVPDLEDSDKIVWLGVDTFVCDGCYDTQDVKQYIAQVQG